MSLDIWTLCAPKFKYTTLEQEPWRIVEGQHAIATRKLVDSDEEQNILEELVESAKPPVPYDIECENYHWLLWTPFRYPPLRNGSRFGDPLRRGLWYGSIEIETAFAEVAFYTFLLRAGSKADFGTFSKPVTAFTAEIRTMKGVDLTREPFVTYEDQLSAPDSYAASQPLGNSLRDAGAEIISFRSARCPDHGANIAVTTLSVFKSSKPKNSTSWFCISSAQTVEFKPNGFQLIQLKRQNFSKTQFLVGKKLPAPSINSLWRPQ